MPPAAPRSCEFPGCTSGAPDDNGQPQPYTTRADNQTRAEVMEDLNCHINMKHELPTQVQTNSTAMIEAETKRVQAETAKLLAQNGGNRDTERTTSNTFQQKRDSIPRPSVQENLSDSDWNFFLAQWKRYTMDSHMTDAQEIQQLWAACTPTLQRQLHNGGGA